jgi:hypothetical protein
MEQNQLDRLRKEFERLYRQADFEQPGGFNEVESSQAGSEHLQGWGQRLQQIWQSVSRFFTEEIDDSTHSDPFWWQVHSWRTGVYAPIFHDETSHEAKAWLEGLYQRSSNESDRH